MKTYRVRTEMHVQGHMLIQASSKSEACYLADELLKNAPPHQALDMIQIDRGSDVDIDARTDRDMGVYFFVPVSWCSIVEKK